MYPRCRKDTELFFYWNKIDTFYLFLWKSIVRVSVSVHLCAHKCRQTTNRKINRTYLCRVPCFHLFAPALHIYKQYLYETIELKLTFRSIHILPPRYNMWHNVRLNKINSKFCIYLYNSLYRSHYIHLRISHMWKRANDDINAQFYIYTHIYTYMHINKYIIQLNEHCNWCINKIYIYVEPHRHGTLNITMVTLLCACDAWENTFVWLRKSSLSRSLSLFTHAHSE